MRVLKVVLSLALVAAPGLCAQQTANPVVSSAQEIVTRQAAYILAAAEEMPADKYGYHPTADQWTFGKIVAHVVQANFGVCAMLTPAVEGQAPVAAPKVAETDPKPALTAALKASFDRCDAVLAHLQDSQLGDPIIYFGGAHKVRARALVELTDDLEDHYSQMASYLRLNGMLPPSAAKPKPPAAPTAH